MAHLPSPSDDFVSAAVKGTPAFNGVKYAVATSTLVNVMPSGTAGVNHSACSVTCLACIRD